jgi:PAS domain S-box-containing protein
MIDLAQDNAGFAAAFSPGIMQASTQRRRRSTPFMSADSLFKRYVDLQAYVGWSDADAARVSALASVVEQRFEPLIDDFYNEIQRHPEAAKVFTGGQTQIDRLKQSLRAWLRDSFLCRGDADYVTRRWKIGLRHSEIGLNPAYVAAAMSRLRDGLIGIASHSHAMSPNELPQVVQSLNKLLDVELAIIQDAYQADYLSRETQAVLERSEEKFRILVEAAGCMVVILRPDKTVQYFSPYSEVLTGYKTADVTGCDFVATFVAQSLQAEVASEIQATLDGNPTKALETPIICRDGTQRWLVWNARRLDEFEGAPAVLCVGQDFTERRDAQERSLQSERLAAIGQMITGLAHESRNALQRIQSCSEMLELEVQANDEAVRLVRRLQEAQDNLLRLFDEVRGYAAPIQLERSVCRLDDVWRTAWELLEHSHRERDASLVETIDGAELTCAADRFRLAQLFRILFENSLAACRDPVVIQMSCRDVYVKGESSLEVRVHDNGPGLTPEARHNVFEPFFTTKTKGTGLGMAIARRIVDSHGGQIAVGDHVSPGAEFIVTLPRTSP